MSQAQVEENISALVASFDAAYRIVEENSGLFMGLTFPNSPHPMESDSSYGAWYRVLPSETGEGFIVKVVTLRRNVRHGYDSKDQWVYDGSQLFDGQQKNPRDPEVHVMAALKAHDDLYLDSVRALSDVVSAELEYLVQSSERLTGSGE